MKQRTAFEHPHAAVVNGPAGATRPIVREDAIPHQERAKAAKDAAVARGFAGRQGDAVDFHGAVVHPEKTGGVVAADRQLLRARALDGGLARGVSQDEFTSRQGDGDRSRREQVRRKGNGLIAGESVGVRERFAEACAAADMRVAVAVVLIDRGRYDQRSAPGQRQGLEGCH